jgi:predicted phage terminase large subunit-like protein
MSTKERVAPHKPLWDTLKPAQFYQKKQEAVDDIWTFIDVIDFYGGTSKFDPVHKEMLEHLLSTPERKLVLMSRGHYKSTICSTLVSLWHIYRDPNIRILIGTARNDLSYALVRELMTYLEDPVLQEKVWNDRPHIEGRLVPEITRGSTGRGKKLKQDYAEVGEETEANDKKVVWRGGAIQVVRSKIFKEPTIRACSVNTRVTGEHYDLLILDDVVDYNNCATRAKAAKVLLWTRDLESVLNTVPQVHLPMGQQFWLGTRYYRWDAYGHLLGEDIDDEKEYEDFIDEVDVDPVHVFERNIFANSIDTTEGYLCPRLMNAKTEAKLRRRLGVQRFASQYLNAIIAEEAIKFRHDGVIFIPKGRVVVNKMSASATVYPSEVVQINDIRALPIHVPLVVIIDPAASLNIKADYTAITLGGKGSDDKLYILEMRYGHWTPSQIVEVLYDLCREYGTRRVVIEAVAFQLALLNIVREYFSKENYFPLHLIEFRPKGEKKARIEVQLQPRIESQRLVCTNNLAANIEFRRELEEFPGGRDDILDTIAVIAETLPVPSPRTEDDRRVNRVLNTRKYINSRYGGLR